MAKETIWFAIDDAGVITARVRSARGLKLTLTGEPGSLEPTAEGDARLLANQSLRHNVWAFAGFENRIAELVDEEAKIPLQKKADSHAKLSEQLVTLIDELSDATLEGWCSNCFEKSVHRKVDSNKVRTTTYLCEDCGSPTDQCLAPGCPNMATRSLGRLQLPRFCAEHTHAIPSFERSRDTIDRLEDIHEFLKYDKPHLARGTQLGLTAVLTAGVAFPLALAAAPAVGGLVGVLASQFGAGAALAGGAAVNHGLAILGFGTIAAGGLGMAGGTMVVTGVGAALGGALGASVTNAYVRDDKSFRIELFREGVGTPVVIARGFTTEGDLYWRDSVEFVEAAYPDAPIYFLHWGAKELADIALLIGALGGKEVVKLGAVKLVKQASKKAVKSLGPVMPAVLAADLAKNPWHVARVRADKTGVVLADVISRYTGDVILVGHSLGGRVMATAAQAASTSRSESSIEEICLAGAAIGVDFDWEAVSKSAKGKVWNYFSRRDKVLSLAFAAAEGGTVAAGLRGTGSKAENIHDIDLSEEVLKHEEYWLYLAKKVVRNGRA